MILLAVRMLMGDKLKFIGLVAGMSFAAMMVCQQASIFVGLAHQTGTFIRERSFADLWVMDDQVRFSEDSQPLPEMALHRIRSIDGVRWAVPMYKGWLKARLADGTRTTVIVVGVDDATLIGAPSEMVWGDLGVLRQDRAIIIHHKDAGEKLALKKSGGAGLAVGDRLSINDHEAVVAGTYDAPASFFWDPVVYTTYTRALTMAPRERHLTSFLMVKLEEGADLERVRAEIARRTPYVARTSDEFEARTRGFILKSTGILVNFGMAIGLGFVIGVLVTGQTFFNFTLDNLRHFASLKAMGTGDWGLARMVLAQVMVVVALSFGIGVGLASAMGMAILKTDLAFRMPPEVLVGTLCGMMGVGALAAVLSLTKVLRLEPGVVFKA